MYSRFANKKYTYAWTKGYKNDNPELTLTLDPKLVFCTYRRPRYQVSVNRAIGSLVEFASTYFIRFFFQPKSMISAMTLILI